VSLSVRCAHEGQLCRTEVAISRGADRFAELSSASGRALPRGTSPMIHEMMVMVPMLVKRLRRGEGQGPDAPQYTSRRGTRRGAF
jgi:hypothetical protein